MDESGQERGGVSRKVALAVALLVALGGLWLLGRRTRTAPGEPGERSHESEPAAARETEPVAARETERVPGAPVPSSPRPASPPTPRRDPRPKAVASPESALLDEMRAKLTSDPARVETLARQARARFGDSALSDERDALLVDALINLQRIGSARSEAYYYYDHHRDGAFAAHLFARTGVHPTPPTPGPH